MTEGRFAEQERRMQMEAFGRSVRTEDEDYWREFREWDAVLGEMRSDDGEHRANPQVGS